MLVDALQTLFHMNRLRLGPFALLPSKYGDPDSRVGRHRVMELFEKATENRRYKN
jgi:hypothetical protein